jgi:hypothetical protein
MKIIQIEGIRGLITAVFMGVCLFAGFVIFPGEVAMHYWNKYLVDLCMFPQLNLFQGILLWGIIAVSYLILTKRNLALSLKNTPELSDEELESIIKSAKINSQMRMMNRIISKSDIVDFTKNNKDNPFEQTSVSSQTPTENQNDEKKISNLK